MMRKAIAALCCAMTIFVGNSQSLKVPANHKTEHKQLQAYQHPAATAINNVNTLKLQQQQQREEQKRRNEEIEEIYRVCWNSQSVNPYGNSVKIPSIKNIDVSGYVSPLDKVRVSSPYGWRPKFGRMHRGVDMSLKIGDTIRAAFNGKIRVVRCEPNGYGNYVVIRHDNGLETVYGHMSRQLVKPNQEVKAGDPIGLGGNTGRSTGPHLHFETRYMGMTINPANIIDLERKTIHAEVFTFNQGKVRAEEQRARSNRGSVASK